MLQLVKRHGLKITNKFVNDKKHHMSKRNITQLLHRKTVAETHDAQTVIIACTSATSVHFCCII